MNQFYSTHYRGATILCQLYNLIINSILTTSHGVTESFFHDIILAWEYRIDILVRDGHTLHTDWQSVSHGGAADASLWIHCDDVIMSTIASQITSHTIVFSTVYSGADQRKHQSSASLAFVRGTHRWPVNSPHKGPVTRKIFPFDDVTMSVY